MKYLFALFLGLVSFGSARADSRDTTVTNVPFDFVIGNKTFPAGTYTISRLSDDPQRGLLIENSDGKTNGIFQATTAQATTSNDEPRLQFLHEGDEYFLTEIVGDLETYTVAPSHHHRGAVNADEAVVISVSP